MQRIWLTLMVLLPLQLMAQDLSGIWKGTLTQEAGGCYPVYFVELQVKFSGPLVSGKLYDYYDSSKFVKLGISGRYDSATQRMSFSENKVLKSHIPADCVPCIKSYELTFSKTGTEERLTGSWKGHILDRAKSCPPGALTLQRTYKSAFPADPKDDLGPEIIQQDSLVHIQQMLRLPSRDKELVKTVFVTVPQITIELYDNGEIDNDTITVFVNNTLILYQQRLSEKPLTLHINALEGKEYELIMYADNLGLIPPNTALMVVTAGNKKMEVFMSSSEQKSAAVRFVYRKPE